MQDTARSARTWRYTMARTMPVAEIIASPTNHDGNPIMHSQAIVPTIDVTVNVPFT